MQFKDLYRFNKTIIILLTFIFTIPLFSQQWQTKIYTEKDGLPTSIIYCVKRDSNGVLWIGHEYGVSRFDGNEWINYGKESGLIHTVYSLNFYGNAIWCGCNDGIYMMETDNNTSKNKFHYVKDFKKGYLTSDLIVWNNRLWANSVRTSMNDLLNKNKYLPLKIIRKKDTSFKYKVIKFKEDNYLIKKILITSFKNTLWIIDKGIRKIESDNINKIKNIYYPIIINKNSLQGLMNCEKNEEGLFICKWSGLDRYKNGKIKNLFKGTCVAVKTIDNHLWVSKPGTGVIIFNKSGDILEDSITINQGLSNSFVHGYIYKDFDGSIWIPSYCGLTHIYSPNTRYYFQNRTIKAIAEFNNHIFIGYEKTIYQFDNKKIKKIHLTPKNEYHLIDEIKTWKNHLWISNGFNLIRMNKKGIAKKINFQREGKKKIMLPIRKFVITKKGAFLIAMSRGFVYFPPSDFDINNAKIFIHIDNNSFKKKGHNEIQFKKVLSFALDSSYVWIGTDNGLFLFDESRKKLIKPLIENYNTINYSINDIKIHSNKIFLATEKGLKIIVNNKIENYISKELISQANCITFYKDFILLGSKKGLFIINKNKIFRKLTEKSGLPHRNVNKIFKDSGDNIWVATNLGIVKFNANEFLHSQLVPKLVINKIMENNKVIFFSISPQRIVSPKIIKLSKYNNRLSINLCSNYLETANDINYELSIKNGNLLKIMYSKKPCFQINDLDVGNNKINIRARLNSNKWSNSIRLTVISPQPFYLTIKFILLEILIIIILGLLIAYLRTKSVRKRNLFLKNEVEKQTAILRDTNKQLEEKISEVAELSRIRAVFISFFGHDISNALANIRRGIELLHKGYSFDSKISSYNLDYYIKMSINRMINIVKKVLMVGRIETKRIIVNPQLIDIRALINEEYEKNLPYLDEKNLKIKINYLQDNIIVNSDLELLKQIFENILNNAIKYSFKNGIINIECTINEKYCQIIIKDSGPGFKEEDKEKLFTPFQKLSAIPTGGESSTGLGLWIVKSLLDLLGGTIYIKNYEKGAEVTILIPNKL